MTQDLSTSVFYFWNKLQTIPDVHYCSSLGYVPLLPAVGFLGYLQILSLPSDNRPFNPNYQCRPSYFTKLVPLACCCPHPSKHSLRMYLFKCLLNVANVPTLITSSASSLHVHVSTYFIYRYICRLVQSNHFDLSQPDFFFMRMEYTA